MSMPDNRVLTVAQAICEATDIASPGSFVAITVVTP